MSVDGAYIEEGVRPKPSWKDIPREDESVGRMRDARSMEMSVAATTKLPEDKRYRQGRDVCATTVSRTGGNLNRR